MTINKMAEALSLRPLAVPEGERACSGVYIGDLLSWVMGRAQSGNVWITIMSNINIVAVASLTEVSCIVLAEGVVPEEDVVRTAEQKGINLFCAKEPAYELAVRLNGLGL